MSARERSRCDAARCAEVPIMALRARLLSRGLVLDAFGERRLQLYGYVALCSLHAAECGAVQLSLPLTA